jgi:hypothetical protein
MEVNINAGDLIHLRELAVQNGTLDKWTNLVLEWLQKFDEYERNNEDVIRWRHKALEYCVEVYEQYTRAEVNNFNESIIRCWKIGKSASKNVRDEE